MLSEKQWQVHARNPVTAETRRKMSGAAKRRHALNPQSEKTRRRISAGNKANWAKRLSRSNNSSKRSRSIAS